MPATLDDFMRLPEGTLAEFIGGEILMSPSPKSGHQRLVGDLLLAVGNSVSRDRLGEVYTHLDVHLPNGDVVQPDLLYISTARAAIIQDWVRGAPDLVVEVLSPETRRRDIHVKADLYLANGVLEVWLVDPDAKSVEIRRPEGTERIEFGGTVRSPLLPGFELETRGLFT